MIMEVTHKQAGSRFRLVLVHCKSKKTYKKDADSIRVEALNNRKKIVSQCNRLRTILFKESNIENPTNDPLIIMGDINDGPGFDPYEAKILYSGVESLIGNVLSPDSILYSFVDLNNGGQPTTEFAGMEQIDHILFTRCVYKERKRLQYVKGSGRVRSDLVI